LAIRRVGVRPPRRTSGNSDNDVNKIFFDDISGQTIGGVAGCAPPPSLLTKMLSKLPEFDNKVERGD
jgi:hypothetical protein